MRLLDNSEKETTRRTRHQPAVGQSDLAVDSAPVGVDCKCHVAFCLACKQVNHAYLEEKVICTMADA